jgi:hypothetical protein
MGINKSTKLSFKELGKTIATVAAGGGASAAIDQLQSGQPITIGSLAKSFGVGAVIALLALFRPKPKLIVPKTLEDQVLDFAVARTDAAEKKVKD